MDNKIIIGEKDSPVLVLNDTCILRCDISRSCDVICNELQIDTVEVEINSRRYEEPLSASDDEIESSDEESFFIFSDISEVIMSLQANTKMFVYHGDACLGLFYVYDVKRTKKDAYEIKGQTIIGLLDKSPFYGCFVDGTQKDAWFKIFCSDVGGMTGTIPSDFKDPLVDIFKEYYYTFLYSTNKIRSIPVKGYIKSGTRRTALQDVLFAGELYIRHYYSVDGVMVIQPKKDVYPILDRAIFSGSSVSYPDSVSAIAVVVRDFEATYSSEDAVVMDDSTNLGSTDLRLVKFEGFNRSVFQGSTSLKLHAYCSNAAIISGFGKLMAMPYILHEYELVSQVPGSYSGKQVRIDENYLVNPDNANIVTNSLANYFSGLAYHDIVINHVGIRNGCLHSFINGFGERSIGWVVSEKISLSAISKANCQFITNAMTDFQFEHYEVLTGSGDWGVPNEAIGSGKGLYVVLVGGGSGGDSGLKGKDGIARSSQSDYSSNSNQGGSNGASGNGGRIKIVTIGSSDLAASYRYSCGAGGAGGGVCYSEIESNKGTDGGNTTFGDFSSSDGYLSESGYLNILSEIVYGARPVTQIPLGNCSGNKSGSGQSYKVFNAGGVHDKASGKYWSGGYTDKTFLEFYHEDGSKWARYPVTYGDGGGAGFGEPGGKPGAPSKASNGTITTGDGGNGGNSILSPRNPLDEDHTRFGWGGYGGYGGGGGGDTGATVNGWPWGVVPGTPGIGGHGGPGGDGAPGCVIVFY